MMNRGILNPIQHIYEPPVVADCFEADIETIETTPWMFALIPPVFWIWAITLDDTGTFELPEINMNLYIDDQLVWQLYAPQVELDPDAPDADEKIQERTEIIVPYLSYLSFEEYWVHRVKLEPIENKAGWARAIWYMLFVLMGWFPYEIVLTLLQQPSNRGYYKSENNIWPGFKFWQFALMTIRNEVVVEPIPDDQFPSANMAYVWQFIDTHVPRVTITAQNWQNPPVWWRMAGFLWDITQLVILWNQMDANVSWEQNRWDMLRGLVWDYWLKIYVNKNLVNNYKALNETIAPYVYSDENIPDPPVYMEPWAYYNAELWLITIYNNWEAITFADKNLWATRVWNWWSVSDDNIWYFYQRWNNNGFTYRTEYWNHVLDAPTSPDQVDTTWYWPQNNYSRNVFVVWHEDWSSVNNMNLWWDWAQGPCPNWFHILSISDIDLYNHLEFWTSLEGLNPRNVLKMPAIEHIFWRDWTFRWNNRYSWYWTATPTAESISTTQAWVYNNDKRNSWTSGDWYMATDRIERGNACQIRPVKNTPVIPDDTWTKIY